MSEVSLTLDGKGEELLKDYTGIPVWENFDDYKQ